MNERLVEDWLAKANERSYQTPFAQSLLAEGMQVLRVGHGSHEHGKDIIALDRDGKVHAYQLKDGDMDLKQFEAGFAQVTALVETPVEHPSIQGQPRHQPCLVFSGKASMPVEDRIRLHNNSWKRRSYNPLRTINGTQLVHRFASMAASFWPQVPEDSRRLFNLYLADGKGPLAAADFAQLIVNTTKPAPTTPKTETTRRLSAANLFASYALSPFYQLGNHWELVQGWTINAAQIAWAAHYAKLPRKAWYPTFRLAIDEALESLSRLADEALLPEALGPAGFEVDELTRSRCTICAGAIGAKVILARHRRASWHQEDRAKRTLADLFSKGRLVVWGESAIPFFLTTAWALDTLRGDQFSDGVLINVLSVVADQNSRISAPKLPPPYDNADEANAKFLRRLLENEKATETQATASYSLEPLVAIVTRRLWRNTLAALWSRITKIDTVRLVPDVPDDLLLWRWGYERGSNETRLFPAPQSWRKLLLESRRDDSESLPKVLKDEFDFAVLFTLCFPHRLTTPFAKHIDKRIQGL